jgi:transcriptional regulator with XRE-family HTH domain
MPRRTAPPPKKLHHQWYLAEWAKVLGKTQADAVREMGWNKTTASHLWNGKQRYSQDYVDELAIWFGLRPYELLMSPDLAMAIRRLRDAAPRLVDDIRDDFNEAAPLKTGT